MANKTATIFDHLANITWKKTNWNTLDEASQKSFSISPLAEANALLLDEHAVDTVYEGPVTPANLEIDSATLPSSCCDS